MDVLGFDEGMDPQEWQMHLYSDSEDDDDLRAQQEKTISMLGRGLARIKVASGNASRKVSDGRRRVEEDLRRLAERAEVKRAQKFDEVRSLVRKALTGNKKKRVRDLVKDEMRKPVTVRLKDKFAFMLGVAGMLMTEGILLQFPTRFWMWYTATMVPLMIIRYVLYHRLKYHYFMLDFCYAVNLMCLLVIFVFRNNAHVFQMTFAVANGPVLWAIPTWRNSLVFHSLDKVTSMWIHMLPCLLTFAIRWHPDTPHEAVCLQEDCSFSWSDTLLMPLLLYATWQLLYVWKTDVHDAKKLKNDPDIQTSARWFLRARAGALYNAAIALCRKMGVLKPGEHPDPDAWLGKTIFMVSQLVYTIITLIPCKLVFESQTTHATMLIVIMMVAIWNGGAYYIEVFSKRYVETLQRLRDQAIEREAASMAAVKELAEAMAGDSSGASEASGDSFDGRDGEMAPLSPASAGSRSRLDSRESVDSVQLTEQEGAASRQGE